MASMFGYRKGTLIKKTNLPRMFSRHSFDVLKFLQMRSLKSSFQKHYYSELFDEDAFDNLKF